MPQTYNAHFKQSMQCTEDSWELIPRNILVNENTTIGEIVTQYRKFYGHTRPTTDLIINFQVSAIIDLTDNVK